MATNSAQVTYIHNVKCQEADWCFDPDVFTLYGPEEDYQLPRKHGQLLQYLIKNQHRYVSLVEIHDSVWNDRIVSDAAVRKVIVELKKFLKTNQDEDIIENRRALGYRLTMPFGMKNPIREPIRRNSCQESDVVRFDDQGNHMDSLHKMIKHQQALLEQQMETLKLFERMLLKEEIKG